jgi:hypothetical protein
MEHVAGFLPLPIGLRWCSVRGRRKQGEEGYKSKKKRYTGCFTQLRDPFK